MMDPLAYDHLDEQEQQIAAPFSKLADSMRYSLGECEEVIEKIVKAREEAITAYRIKTNSTKIDELSKIFFELGATSKDANRYSIAAADFIFRKKNKGP